MTESEHPSEERLPVDDDRREQLEQFLARHGITPGELSLYDVALTHSSYAFENNLGHDNERLEFLGDAVLGLLVSLHLYRSHHEHTEGDLSKLKAQLVSRNVLGRLGFDLRIGDVMLFGRGEERTGGRHRLSVLGSALEALVGAIYLDKGLDAVQKFVAPFLLNVHDTITQHEAFQDYKSQLQELVQKTHGCVPRYVVDDEVGPDHDKTFFVTVHVDDEPMGTGKGRRVKSAENRAAQAALQKLLGSD